MDEYDRKLKELRTYVPFLTKMIDKLEKAGDKSKEAQLAKMKSLKGILTTTDKKGIRLETLIKCEDVLHKLYEKVEGAPVTNMTPSSSQHQQRPRSPRDRGHEAPSLSSYLQQIHDNQHHQQQQHQPQNNRFQGRPSPWMNDPRGPGPPQHHPGSGPPWQQRGHPRMGMRPGFHERPDPWGGNRPPFQPAFHPQDRFRTPFGNNVRRPMGPGFHGPPFGDRPPFQERLPFQQNRPERPNFWDNEGQQHPRGPHPPFDQRIHPSDRRFENQQQGRSSSPFGDRPRNFSPQPPFSRDDSRRFSSRNDRCVLRTFFLHKLRIDPKYLQCFLFLYISELGHLIHKENLHKSQSDLLCKIRRDLQDRAWTLQSHQNVSRLHHRF